MQPTLEPGDVILVDTWAYRNQAPQLGDIIIFLRPMRTRSISKTHSTPGQRGGK